MPTYSHCNYSETKAGCEAFKKEMKRAATHKIDLTSDLEICPLCEDHTTIRKHYEKHTYNIRGHNISVRQSVSRCENCGDSWTNSQSDNDGIEEAYTIYLKRINPEARKFNKLYFIRGKASALICLECCKKYDYHSWKRVKTSNTCSSKGCNNRSCYRIFLEGKFGGDQV